MSKLILPKAKPDNDKAVERLQFQAERLAAEVREFCSHYEQYTIGTIFFPSAPTWPDGRPTLEETEKRLSEAAHDLTRKLCFYVQLQKELEKQNEE